MNFPTVPTVPQALMERASHPAYGYFETTDAYYDAIIQWQVQRNGCDPALLTRDCIGYENGVLGGGRLGPDQPGRPRRPGAGPQPHLHRLYQVPAGQRLPDRPLAPGPGRAGRVADGLRRHGPQTEAVPHPCGHPVQPPQPLRPRLDPGGAGTGMAVYQANRCVVISDEIWSDILLNGHKHTPTQSVSPDARSRTIALYAPSKTFNLAGLVGSYHIHLRRLPAGLVPRPGVQMPLQQHERPVHARPDRRLPGPKGRSGWTSCARCSRATSTMPAITSGSTLEGVEAPGPKAPICCLWTAPSGARPTARPSTTWKRPPGRWASPSRTAGCSK